MPHLDFEWDEAKRLTNIRKHGLDFLRVGRVFAGDVMVVESDQSDRELRWLATGLLDQTYVTVVFTRRGLNIRIISMRRARGYEKTRYKALFEQ